MLAWAHQLPLQVGEDFAIWAGRLGQAATTDYINLASYPPSSEADLLGCRTPLDLLLRVGSSPSLPWPSQL